MSRPRGFWDGEDPAEYYNENYAGLSRAELEKTDCGLYKILWSGGLLDVVIPEKKTRPWDGGNPVVYYNAHFAGLSRGQLQRAGEEGSRCYRALKKQGLLDVAIPKKRECRPWDKGDPVGYCKKNFAGLSRDQLKHAGPEGRKCYDVLLRQGLLGVAIPKKQEKLPWVEGEPVVYYKKHFAGLSRSQLHSAGRDGRRCYRALKDQGLLDVAIPEKQNKPWDEGDPVEYYNTHFAGLSRGQLQSAGEEGSRCYYALKRHGLLDVAIPETQRLPWVEGDPVVYYKTHFAGLSRGQLYGAGTVGRRCYNALRSGGLLDVVIPLKAKPVDLEGMLDDIVGDGE